MSKKLRTEGLNEFILIYIRNKYLQRKIPNFFFFFFLLEELEWGGVSTIWTPLSIIVTGFVHRQIEILRFFVTGSIEMRVNYETGQLNIIRLSMRECNIYRI